MNSIESEPFSNVTVSEIVIQNPGAADIFEKYKIDYCCNGTQSLVQACRSANISESQILEELKLTNGNLFGTYGVENWSLDLLISYILQSHHQYTKEALPRMQSLSKKVLEAHGSNHPELVEVMNLVNQLTEDLQLHMGKEESILFPAIVNLVNHSRNENKFALLRFYAPIQVMIAEHESAGTLIKKIRLVTHDFTVPLDACLSYRQFYKLLHEFEKDLHRHVHLENNILFPKALELETNFLN